MQRDFCNIPLTSKGSKQRYSFLQGVDKGDKSFLCVTFFSKQNHTLLVFRGSLLILVEKNGDTLNKFKVFK